MIIISTYIDGFELDKKVCQFKHLENFLLKILPHNICLHLLPFYPASGDFGFAPDNWFQVRKDLGSWEDVVRLTEKWFVLVEGIYNHVSINHEWFIKFSTDHLSHKSFFYTFENINTKPEDGPLSPRGQPVLQNLIEGLLVWQTFNEFEVDIRLDNELVIEEVNAHIKFLKSKGIWGVRLDAVAYYAKSLGKQNRHNLGCHQLADNVATLAINSNLNVIAQLDCDDQGVSYFQHKDEKIPIYDFTYSVILALALIDEHPNVLIKHLHKTDQMQKILIRAPRTHDGILLRSKVLDPCDLERIIAFAESNNIKVNTINNVPHELNCSAPFLYSKIAPDFLMETIILFTVAVTGMSSGWSNFYLPYLIGFIPENLSNANINPDPRTTNRLPIDNLFIENYLGSQMEIKMKALIELLQKIHDEQKEHFTTNTLNQDQLLIMTTKDKIYTLLANFSKTQDIKIPTAWFNKKPIFSNNFQSNVLSYLGIALMKNFE